MNPLRHLEEQVEEDGSMPKLLRLYEGIACNDFQTDEDAAMAIYDGDTEGSKYRKLKSDLRDHLVDAIININPNQNDYSDYQKAYLNCHRQWVAVRFLTGMNANTAALVLAKKVLRQAERYDFTLLCMDIASYLRIQYGLRESDDKNFKIADKMFAECRDLYDAECKAEQYYTYLIVRYVNNRSARKQVHALAVQYEAEIAPLLTEKASYKLQMYGYMICLLRCSTVNEYEQALKVSRQAIDFFEARPYEARVPLQIFYYQNLICTIQLRQFEAGEKAAKDCLAFMKEGTFNWFKYQELYLHLLLHTREYERAAQTLKTILNHSRFQFLPDNAKELWLIYEAYIYYLHLSGELQVVGQMRFKLSKFINEVPIFTKDKGGVNVAVIIVRMLILLKERRFDTFLAEMESVNQYCYKYLNNDQTRRSFTLIKMLLSIPTAQYDPDTIEQRVAKFKVKLEEAPCYVDNQNYEVEIIPYEHLWDFAMKDLKERVSRFAGKKGDKARRVV